MFSGFPRVPCCLACFLKCHHFPLLEAFSWLNANTCDYFEAGSFTPYLVLTCMALGRVNSSDPLKCLLIKDRWKVQGGGQGPRGHFVLKGQAGEAGLKTTLLCVIISGGISPALEINVLLSSVVYPFFVNLIYRMYE